MPVVPRSSISFAGALTIALWGVAPANASCDQGSNPNELRLQAQEFAARQDYDAALAAIDCARARAPEDLDIRLARARILLWRGDTSKAREEVEAARKMRSDYPGLDEVASAIDAARQRRSAIFLTASVSDLDIGGTRRRWTGLSFSGTRQVARSGTLAVTIDHENRIIASDTRGALRFDRRWRDAAAYVAISTTPSATFRERWSLGGGVEVESGAFALMLDYRYAEYVQAETHSVSPALRMRISQGLSATVRTNIVATGALPIQMGVSGRLDAELGDRLTLYAGAASGPETEAGITRQVRGGFLGLSAPISRRVDFRLTVDHERREATYTRTGVAFGLSMRFGPE